MKKNILILRSLSQSSSLTHALAQQGFEPICIPTLDIKPCSLPPQLLHEVACWKNVEWVIFTSVNAVEYGLKALTLNFFKEISAQIVAIGPATHQALKNQGFKEILMPAIFSSEGLLTLWPQLSSQKFLIITGKNSRTHLADTFREHHAKFLILETYERFCPEHEKEPLQNLWQNKKIDVILVLSAESLENLKILLGEKFLTRLLNTQLIVLSERLKTVAETMGFKKIIAAPENSVNGLLQITGIFL